jgi:hypothetical protein
MGFALLAGCGGVVSSTASSPVNLPHHNPAQPAATFEIIRQGDPCKVFGATTTDYFGTAFDCEPFRGDGVNRWIIP